MKLDVDTLIRSLTANRKSLDDFEKLFLGRGVDAKPTILPYSLPEVIEDLNHIARHDWATFFQDRVANLQRHADLDGIVRADYKLVYTEHPSGAEQFRRCQPAPEVEHSFQFRERGGTQRNCALVHGGARLWVRRRHPGSECRGSGGESKPR